MTQSPLPRASEQDGTYPRPQLVRDKWVDLGGEWMFEYDDLDEGLAAHWAAPGRIPEGRIIVPYPPESSMSGVGDTSFHPVVWYRRRIDVATLSDLPHPPDRDLLVHFGAVDFTADVWIDGAHITRHEGGSTPFTVTVPRDTGDEFEIVVRAHDDPLDLTQPRGKQDWEVDPHIIWYPRTTGIWQTVWLESVPSARIVGLQWTGSPALAHVDLDFALEGAVSSAGRVLVTVFHGDEVLGTTTTAVTRARGDLRVSLPALRNGQDRERFTWSPEHPTLLDATVELVGHDGESIDIVTSYLGLRSVSAGSGRLLLNDRPYPIVGVLSQGYWPTSHLAAPSPAALRDEVQLIKDLGFTTARVHQKIEDPRFLFWADRLGLLIWTELPSAYEFDARATERLLREWTDVIRRDYSHPSIVVWVPFNESWGVGEIATDAAQQHLARSLYHLTKSLDPTRLVISNDGWEHTESDLLTVHDYENDPERVHASYGDPAAVERTISGVGPNGRATVVGDWRVPAGIPVVLSEFGGVSIVDDATSGEWGYREVATPEELAANLAGLFARVRASSGLAGWCYTQLSDTAQETNGLTDGHRVPKLPVEKIRSIVTGCA